jgi:predicted transcriptional regulator
LDYQNVTVSIPKDILKKAKHIAIDRHTSLSGLLSQALEEIVEKEDAYSKAKDRQLVILKNGFDMGLKGKINWGREDLHARK